jgi:hypothetical protein
MTSADSDDSIASQLDCAIDNAVCFLGENDVTMDASIDETIESKNLQ